MSLGLCPNDPKLKDSFSFCFYLNQGFGDCFEAEELISICLFFGLLGVFVAACEPSLAVTVRDYSLAVV